MRMGSAPDVNRGCHVAGLRESFAFMACIDIKGILSKQK